jgi:hypothetical protein
MKISNKKIERSLRMSLTNITNKNMMPNIINNLGEGYKMKKRIQILPVLMTSLAAFIAIFIMGSDYYDKNIKVGSNILLDVNPSISISTNYYNKVINVKALNDDGEEILNDIDVYNLTPEDAINKIIDELKAQGYLEGDGANILLTVQNNDLKKAKEIEANLLTTVNAKLDEEYIAGTLMTQVSTIKLNIDEELLNLMNQYNISYSKSLFINNITKKDSSLLPEQLATLKISEISKILDDNNIDMSDVVGHNDEDSVYENEALTKARKAADDAEQVKIQAEIKAQNALGELQTQIQNQENLEAAERTYEEAEKIRQQAENEALEAKKAYEEMEANKSQGSTTQNTNGQIDNTQGNTIIEEQTDNGSENASMNSNSNR